MNLLHDTWAFTGNFQPIFDIMLRKIVSFYLCQRNRAASAPPQPHAPRRRRAQYRTGTSPSSARRVDPSLPPRRESGNIQGIASGSPRM
ncbi:MAG TPA: hypothetical protein VGR45_04310, partial [Stellaceae bacterium]|nr:hypothetical protein [Stellaceae bacterium]